MPKARAFLFVLLGFAAGVLLRSFFAVPQFLIFASIACACAFVSYGLCNRVAYQGRSLNLLVVSGLVIASFAFGVLRYDAVDMMYQDPFTSEGIARYVILRGIVIEEPYISADSVRLTLELKGITNEDEEKLLSGRIVAYVDQYPRYTYGDELRLFGVLHRPEAFDGFDYAGYLKSKGVYALMRRPKIEIVSRGQGSAIYELLLSIKQQIEFGVERILPEPHAALLKGLLVGSRTGIPEDVSENLRRTGTTHIIALSGFNITIIAENIAVVVKTFGLGAAANFWVPVWCVVSFTVMTGASASVVRASIMGILILVARAEGRGYMATNAIVFAGAVMLFYDPRILRFDIGFQLSFLATFGIVYAAPALAKRLQWVTSRFGIRENLASTLGAQAIVLPVLIYHFGTLSFISPLANIGILSVIPLTMAFGSLAVLAGFLSPVFGMVIGAVSYILLSYELFVVEVLGALPFASLELGTIGLTVLAVIYLGVIVKMFFVRLRRYIFSQNTINTEESQGDADPVRQQLL